MVAITQLSPAPAAPHLRLVRSAPAPRPSAAVYRRRRLAVALLVAAAVAAGCVLLSVRAGDGASTVRTATAPVVVHDPAAYGAAHLSPPAGAVYVVQPGDTIWSIARQLAPTAGDVRPLVDRIVELNGSAALTTGQRLRLQPPGP